jgi:hypothetical protein
LSIGKDVGSAAKVLARRRENFERGKANVMTSRFAPCTASMAIAAASALIIPAAANTTAAAMPWCAIDSMSLSIGAPPAPDSNDQGHFPVVLTNISNHACTLQGYPDVDLLGPDDPLFGPTYRLPQQVGDPQPLTLAPGASASSVLTFLPGPPNGWVPRTIVVTLPDTSAHLETSWIPGGVSVLRQDAATHPGTYIGPLQSTD